jgi:hypothetical protein
MKLERVMRKPYFPFPFFFIALFLFFLLVYDSSLYYHFHQPLFLFDRIFAKEFLLYPGGLIEWIARFFVQFFYFNWAGSFIISIVILSILAISCKLAEKIAKPPWILILSSVPVILLLVIQSHYNFPFIITVKYFISLLLFSFYRKTATRYKAIFIVLYGFVYVTLGGWMYLFYMLLCIIHEVLFSKGPEKYLYAGLNLVACLLYPYVAARYFFIMTLKEAYLYLVPYEFYYEPFSFKPDAYLYLFFLAMPASMAFLFVYEKSKVRVRRDYDVLWGMNFAWAQPILVLLVAGLLVALSFDQDEKKKIRIDYLAEQGRWQELLSLSQDIKEYDRLVNFNTNRAFYHTGQLLDNLFAYNQMFGADGLFIDRFIASQIAIPSSDLYFDLGHINASQVMAYEGLTKYKYNPRILKRLALTNIINGKYNTAKIFLDLLGKSILHKKWAAHYRNYLDNEYAIKMDRFIQEKRDQRPKVDFFLENTSPHYDLIRMLWENNRNKMAFEYLMADYLLEGKIWNVLERLKELKNYGYVKMPRHLEEALLLAKAMHPSRIDISAYSIDPNTFKRFREFNLILNEYSGNQATKAKEVLAKDFHDTYWYYVRYVMPRKEDVKTRKASNRNEPLL